MNVTAVATEWGVACRTEDVPEDGGVCALIRGEQVAIFNFTRLGKWFATQNECPHRQQMAIFREMIGTAGDVPKVACPFHKKTFSLETGACLNDDECGSLRTFPIRIKNGQVYVARP